MDFTFSCPFCNQELSIDDSASGQEIPCPSCNETLIVPAPGHARGTLTVQHHAGASAKIQKANVPLEVAAKGQKKIHLKSFRRAEWNKDGKDRFDEVVTAFLQKIGKDSIYSIQPIQYSFTPPESTHSHIDYGVVIYFFE
jgi:ribosomal protein S27E